MSEYCICSTNIVVTVPIIGQITLIKAASRNICVCNLFKGTQTLDLSLFFSLFLFALIKSWAMSEEKKIEEITNILKEEVRLSSEDPELNEKKFIPHPPPSTGDVNKSNDPEKSGANLIQVTKGDVLLNTLTPREQEREGRYLLCVCVC